MAQELELVRDDVEELEHLDSMRAADIEAGVVEEDIDYGHGIVPHPVTGTRGEGPGIRGCWAYTVAGAPCGAPARNGEPYCNAHAGIGVAADPVGYGAKGVASHRERARTRAAMRLYLGTSRTWTPRGALRAAATVSAGALAARAVDAALSPATDDVAAARLALELIREADPATHVDLSVTMPATLEDVGRLGLEDLERLATPPPPP